MRGEYQTGIGIGVPFSGSPPHAWGIRSPPSTPRDRVPVHPHMRGEYPWCHRANAPCAGSPPHAWGIRNRGVLFVQLPRFTPTCVGNTFGRRATTRKASVHPHMRGEYSTASASSIVLGGSPPHAWGILDHRKTVCRLVGSPPHAWGILLRGQTNAVPRRFTPTCVGNTPWRFTVCVTVAVHPHMRGEYAFVA